MYRYNTIQLSDDRCTATLLHSYLAFSTMTYTKLNLVAYFFSQLSNHSCVSCQLWSLLCDCWLIDPLWFSDRIDLFVFHVRTATAQSRSFACISPSLWNRHSLQPAPSSLVVFPHLSPQILLFLFPSRFLVQEALLKTHVREEFLNGHMQYAKMLMFPGWTRLKRCHCTHNLFSLYDNRRFV